MINNENSAVIIFAKLPMPGKVKTRLASELGNDFAVEFYKKCAEHIFNELQRLQNHKIDCCLFYGTNDEVSEVKKWVDKNFIFCPQSEGHLGEKMRNAFQNIFADKYKKVIIIGTDIPDITAEILLNAFSELEKNDIVISPSNDGGYNFLGMTNFYPSLFNNIKWSTEEVFQETIRKIEALGLNMKITQSLLDIDDKADLMSWLENLDTGNSQLKLIVKNNLKNVIEYE